jgi:hypothetical protein
MPNRALQNCQRLPLSNPIETINLAGIAEPGIGPVAGCGWAAFMRLQGHDAGPIFTLSIQPKGRTGSGDLESVAGNSATVASGASPEDYQALSGFPWDFERLSHVAVN